MKDSQCFRICEGLFCAFVGIFVIRTLNNASNGGHKKLQKFLVQVELFPNPIQRDLLLEVADPITKMTQVKVEVQVQPRLNSKSKKTLRAVV